MFVHRYGIHRKTLTRKLKPSTTPPRKSGGQTALSSDEEKVIVSHLIAVSTYGFPATPFELRLMVKSYLCRSDRKVAKFKNNMPGEDWAASFLKRHKNELSRRMSQNISRSRAILDSTVINSFFDNLERELEGIPPENMWNYDESNLQDDPGCKKVIVKRGAKHPDIIKNATKVAVSIMMCGNAAGSLAPVYVVYKAEGLYECWMEGGPQRTRYNRSKSGWFDSLTFEDWFEYLMLPLLKKQNGTKVLIGDNLSSHLSYRVLSLCHENDIKFICLPPHATHLLQPLDVSFFRPMKRAWRIVLDKWKETPEGRKMSTVPKTIFPRLLSQLMDKLEDKKKANLEAGFRSCGIFPLDRTAVLKKLCDNTFANSGDHIENVSQAFLEELRSKRGDNNSSIKKRRKKVDVPPGKGITMDDIPCAQMSNGEKKCTNKRQKKNDLEKRKQKSLKKRDSSVSSDEEFSEKDIVYDDSDDSVGELGSLFGQEYDSVGDPGASNSAGPSGLDPQEVDTEILIQDNCNEVNSEIVEVSGDDEAKIGDHVAVKYCGKLYPGLMMTSFDEAGDAQVSAMQRRGKNWIWPHPPDVLWYHKHQIIRKIKKPVQIGNGESFYVDLKR